jgi:ribosomal protein S18 acetylase RimI-like enzyme
MNTHAEHQHGSIKKYVIWALLAVCVGVGLWYALRTTDAIVLFDEARDTREVIQLFEADRYWLTSTPGYSVENMLKFKSPDGDAHAGGKLRIKVLREHGKLIGFTAYYMLRLGVGKVLFVGVNKEYRGKRYGEQLLAHAVKELQKMGAQVVQLTTRTDNVPGQKLYRRFGFDETGRDDTYGLVFFEYRPR